MNGVSGGLSSPSWGLRGDIGPWTIVLGFVSLVLAVMGICLTFDSVDGTFTNVMGVLCLIGSAGGFCVAIRTPADPDDDLGFGDEPPSPLPSPLPDPLPVRPRSGPAPIPVNRELPCDRPYPWRTWQG